MKNRVEEAYGEVLETAREYERRCFEGKRWGGHALLIIVDAALDSIGLKYFQIVVPRVKQFYENYVKTGQIASLQDFARLSPQDARLTKIMNNERCWRAAIDVCKELDRIRKEKGLKGNFEALRFWAERANYENWKEDPVGKISGIGLITFQYLRMQAGVDTTMPDKIVKRAALKNFGIKAKNDVDFIKKMEVFSKETGYSQVLLCWAIWLKESDAETSH